MANFRELKVWHKARELANAVYDFTADFPKNELYGLLSQLRRAAVSVMSNIAEGSLGRTSTDFARFVSLARSSTAEVESLLVLAQDRRYGEESLRRRCETLESEIARMLTALQNRLNRQ